MSSFLSKYLQHSPDEMLQGASKAARRVSEGEWDLGAWLLAIERTRAFESCGFRNTVGYAMVRLGLEPQKAGNLLRIMGALEGLPSLSKAFQKGEIGYAKIREVTRVATAETEGSWLEYALTHTTDQVRQRVVCSPAAFERRVRSIRNEVDSLFASRSRVSTAPSSEPRDAPDGSRVEGEPQADETRPASAPSLSCDGRSPDADGTAALLEDSLPAPQRVRLVLELSGEEYAEWGATVERVSRQFGRKTSHKEVMLELSRRHVASTGGLSLERNPVVVRLDADGTGFVQTDRGPLEVSRPEEYLSRASSVVFGSPGSEPGPVSVLLLGSGRRRRKKIPSETLRALVARSGGGCECCGQRGVLHVHHVRPLSRGGTNESENLCLLCSACHSREHAGDFQSGSSWERARAHRRRGGRAGRSGPTSRGRPVDGSGPSRGRPPDRLTGTGP